MRRPPPWVFVLGASLTLALLGAPIARALNPTIDGGGEQGARGAAAVVGNLDDEGAAGGAAPTTTSLVETKAAGGKAGSGRLDSDKTTTTEYKRKTVDEHLDDLLEGIRREAERRRREHAEERQREDEQKERRRKAPDNEAGNDTGAQAPPVIGVAPEPGGDTGDGRTHGGTGLAPGFGGTAPSQSPLNWLSLLDDGFGTGTGTRIRTDPGLVTIPGMPGFPPFIIDLPGARDIGAGGTTDGGFSPPPGLDGGFSGGPDIRIRTGDQPFPDRRITTPPVKDPALPATGWDSLLGWARSLLAG